MKSVLKTITNTMGGLKQLTCNKSFGGYQKVYSHESEVLKCTMKFGIYLPPECEEKNVPVIYWLSGLTCTEQNFITKAGSQLFASKYKFIVVAPDTSPRGVDIPGQEDSGLGPGAGFYIDATQEPWNKHYKMYSYITKELPEVINNNFPADAERQSLMGHSMGGHGALICYLKNPGKYRSVSTFAAVCNPTMCSFGRAAFAGYLGGNANSTPNEWHDYDATSLVSKFNGPASDILIDQGTEDGIQQLLPDNFMKACKKFQVPAILHMREGYDHSYYYISSFIGEHFEHHAKYLKN